MHPTLTVISPVYNEEEVLPELYRRVSEVLDGADVSWEMVLVNDGSRDRSAEIIAQLHAQDARVKGISFSRNFGFQEAVTAGLDHARGRAVVLTDADLQDPPEVILEMLEKWREGYDVVYGVRQSRAGETWFKKVTAKMFYRLIHRITSVNIPLDTGDFRLMDHRVVESLTTMRERNRFLRGMVPWVGYKQTGVLYNREPRFAGESKFGTLRPMLKFALNAITSFSYVPLQLATYLGFIIATIALVSIILVIFLRLFTPSEALLGQATTLVAVLFLGGVQLISLGIIGEYLGRIYDEVKGRPLYLVAETWGFDKEHPEAHSGREEEEEAAARAQRAQAQSEPASHTKP